MSRPPTVAQVQDLLRLFCEIGVSSARLQSLMDSGLLLDLCRVADPSKIDWRLLRGVLAQPNGEPEHVDITVDDLRHLLSWFEEAGLTEARLQTLIGLGYMTDMLTLSDPSKVNRERFQGMLAVRAQPRMQPIDPSIDDLPHVNPDEALIVPVSKTGVELLAYYGLRPDGAGWDRMDYPEFKESWEFPGDQKLITISFFPIHRQMTTQVICRWMQREGYRPAKLYELAAMGQCSDRPRIGWTERGPDYVSLEIGFRRNRDGVQVIAYPALGTDQESCFDISLMNTKPGDVWEPRRNIVAVGVKVFP